MNIGKYENYIERIPESGCWIWMRATKKTGLPYGWVTTNNKQINAHRMIYQLVFGEISKSLFVLHRCDVPQCVNPAHLFLGNSSDNMQDMWDKKRHTNDYLAKLTLPEVMEIRNLISEKIKTKFIAKRFNVSLNTIRYIEKGKTWRRYENI